MATLPRFRSTRTVPTGRAEVRRPLDSPLAAGVGVVAGVVDRAEANRDRAWAMQQMADLRVEFAERADETERANQASPDGTANRMGADFEARRAEIAGIAPSDRARRVFDERAQLFGADVRGRARGFETRQRANNQAQAIGSAIDRTANLLRSDPTQYADARADMAALLADAEATLPADAVRVLREGAEQSYAQSALQAGIDADPDTALEALHSGDYDARLSPGQKNTLINQAEAERDRRRREAERGQAVAQTAYLNEAEDYVAFLRAGNLEADERFSVENQVAMLGADKAAALQQEIDRAWRFGGDSRVVQTGSPEEVAEVFAARAPALETPEDFQVEQREFADLRGIWQDTIEAREDDPAAEALRGAALQPAYAELLAARESGDPVRLADAAAQYGALNEAEQQRLGVPAHLRRVLPNEDMAAWGRIITEATPDDATAGLAQFHANFGPVGVDQLAEHLSVEQPALGMAAFYSQRDPRLTSDLLNGARLLEDNRDLRPPPTEIEGPLQELYGDLFEFTPEIRDDFRESAVAVYARSAAGRTDGSFDADAFEQALRRVGGATATSRGELAGGPFRFRGRTVLPVAPGEGADGFARAFFHIDDAALDAYGNGRPTGTQGGRVFADEIRASAQAVPVGFGRYMLLFEGVGFVQAAEPVDGNPSFVFDMARFQDEQGHGFTTPLPDILPAETEAFIREEGGRDLPPTLTQPPLATVPQ